jgi:copper chaperone CopZ
MKMLAGLVAVAAVLIPSVARAELRRAEFTLAGMDCAYCNGAMSAAVKKLEGVESIDLDSAKSAAVIRLKADNTITLQQLRRVIRSVGYDAKDAGITARGRLAADGTTLDLLNGSVLQLAAPHDRTDAIVEVTGTVTLKQPDTEILTIATVK